MENPEKLGITPQEKKEMLLNFRNNTKFLLDVSGRGITYFCNQLRISSTTLYRI
jgi:hypothetical protein